MDDNITVPRMATIKTTAELFKLPIHFIRAAVTNGNVVSVRAGRKFLVNIDSVTAFLSTGKPQGAAANDRDSSRRSDEETVSRVTPISLR